jgi:hypothetical protein
MENIKIQPTVEDNLLTDSAPGGYHLETLFSKNILQEFPELQEPKHIPTRNILRDYLVNILRTRQADGDYVDMELVCEGLKESLEKAAISEERSLNIVKSLINTAYTHNGWIQGGGLTFKKPTSVSLTNTQYSQDALEITYEKDLTDSTTALSTIDEMKQAAVHWYYTNLTGNPEVEDISEAEFDRLVAKWSQLKNILNTKLIYGVPLAAGLTTGYATGGLSLGVWHLLTPLATTLGVGALTAMWNRGAKGGSKLYDMQLLGGLKEFKKDTQGTEYIKPLEHSRIKEELRTMWGEKPSKRTRFKEISVSDLHYILARGKQGAEKVQKRTRLVEIVASVALGLYFHGGLLPSKTEGEALVATIPDDPVIKIPGGTGGSNSIWDFFAFDGTGPKLFAPEIPSCDTSCYNPKSFSQYHV